MPAVGRCDNEVCSRESRLRTMGTRYLMPGGWTVIMDGPPKERSIELLACSESCVTALFETLPPSIKARAFTKVANGTREILPEFSPVEECDLCLMLGRDECALHGQEAALAV